MIEHRKHPRFRLFHTTAQTEAFDAPVLDLSRSGMRIQPPVELGVGTALDFAVSDGNHLLEVAGRVRWSRPRDGAEGGSGPSAGVEFGRILSSEVNGVWARLVAESGETGLPLGHRRPPSAGPRVPLLRILSPEDGAVTHHGAVTVIGQVRDPGLGAMIEVNGVRALVYGRRFEARVPLIEGANLVSATVATDLATVCRSPAVRVTRGTL